MCDDTHDDDDDGAESRDGKDDADDDDKAGDAEHEHQMKTIATATFRTTAMEIPRSW